MASKQTTTKLAEGVSVTVTQSKTPPSVSFEIDNKLFSTLNFTLDIAGSNNLRCELKIATLSFCCSQMGARTTICNVQDGQLHKHV